MRTGVSWRLTAKSGLESIIFPVAVTAGLWLALAGAAAKEAPPFEITSIAPYGALPGRIEGRVVGADPQAHKIAPLIFLTGMGYYTKPYCDTPTVAIQSDGSFSLLFTTGGVDHLATIITLLLVPSTARVPCYTGVTGVPEELEGIAAARIDLHRPNPEQREIVFSGESWLVKASSVPVGPGPNLFSDSAENVYVDSQGRLHLRLAQRAGRWYCAEVISTRPVGYGTYTITLAPIPALDPRVVFGAFTYADAQRETREMDLEIKASGKTSDPTNAQYVLQPWDRPGHLRRLTLPSGVPTTHTIRWEQGRVEFRGYRGERVSDSDEIDRWVFTGPVPRADTTAIRFRFNLWLDGGPPPDGREVELVVESFRYEPAASDSSTPNPAAVLNGASFRPAATPGGLISVFGRNLAAETVVANQVPLPRELGGTRVLVNGLPAPLLYVSPTQVNAQVPREAPLGPSVLEIFMKGLAGLAPFRLVRSSPGIFAFPQGDCIAQNSDWKLNTSASPAAEGSAIVTYLTNIGEVRPPVATGQAAPAEPLSQSVLRAAAELGGRPAAIEFLGLAPGLVGVAQANIRIPAGLGPALHLLVVRVDGASSNPCLVAVGNQPFRDELRILSITPASAQAGEAVTLSGNGFRPQLLVRFGQQPALSVSFVNSTAVRAVVPQGSGKVDVIVALPDGRTAALRSAFTYVSPAPVLMRVNPTSGPATGGTTVELVGNYFQQGATVRFGTAPASTVTWVSQQALRAISPPGSGTVDVTVINPDGQSATLARAFTYTAAAQAPRITARIQGCQVLGSVTGVTPPSEFSILIWAKTDKFYIQPCVTEKTHSIRQDGSWGPIDSHSGEVWVQLVKKGYVPPDSTPSLPRVDGVNVLATHGPVGSLANCDVARCPAF